MKKILLVAALFSTSFGFAQTEKNDWLVGGTIGFRTNKNNSEFILSPGAAYFVVNNLAIGGNLLLNFSKSGNINSTDLGIGPMARYYFSKGNFRPFGIINFNYLSTSFKSNGIKSSTNGINALFGIGGAAFINSNVAFEGVAGYNYTKYSKASSNTGFSLNFGFQVYLSKHNIANIKRGKIGE